MSDAAENLKAYQRQLDADGIEVGVSREALDAVLNELVLLRDYAVHMEGRYHAYREHFGTEGTFPDPTSEKRLTAALSSRR
jgi:hypothetical protein